MLNRPQLIFMVSSIVLFGVLGQCEMSIYPGLRRKPSTVPQLQQQEQQQSLSSSSPYDVNTDFLTQLMEGNARRRLQQQFEQQLEYINLQIQRQRERQERLRERYRQQQKLQALAAVEAAALAARTAENRQHIEDEIEKIALMRNYNNNNNNNLNNNYNYNDNNDNNNNNNLDGNGDDDIVMNEEEMNGKITDSELNDNTNIDYSYKIPRPSKIDMNDHRIQFAVGPSDPRFYVTTNSESSNDESNDYDYGKNILTNSRYRKLPISYNYDNDNDNDNDNDDNIDGVVLDDYEEYKPQNFHNPNNDNNNNNNNSTSKIIPVIPLIGGGNEQISSATVNYHRIKPHQISSSSLSLSNNDGHKMSGLMPAHNNDFNALINKLNENNNQNGEETLVAKEPIILKSNMSMYMIALAAGITAAIIVGLFVLSIAWYTFHKRSKAAADVDYPAYGVTGPNKDMSPSGDRKLAQSAQMYHYQHQKQQIMALENHRNNGEEAADMSYVESDDDNEEGDYTVYECPGLAPTGDMEVKNPLFLDETPVTSLGSQPITQVTVQQPLLKKAITNNPTKSMNAVNKKSCNNKNVSEGSATAPSATESASGSLSSQSPIVTVSPSETAKKALQKTKK